MPTAGLAYENQPTAGLLEDRVNIYQPTRLANAPAERLKLGDNAVLHCRISALITGARAIEVLIGHAEVAHAFKSEELPVVMLI